MPAPVLIENSTCRANLTELSGGGCRASLADRPMRHHIQYAANLFKYAPWLTRKCLLRWGSLCAFATIGVLALNLALHSGAGLTDAAGERFGRDFFQFWSSAVLAAAGRPEAAYIVGPHQTVDQPLAYPPIVMLLCRPLAGLSYAHAVVLWGCLGLALFTWSLSRLVGWEMAAFAAVGTPAAFINIFLAQNGCYTSVLLVWGLMLVERFPVRSGILLGTPVLQAAARNPVGPRLDRRSALAGPHCGHSNRTCAGGGERDPVWSRHLDRLLRSAASAAPMDGVACCGLVLRCRLFSR